MLAGRSWDQWIADYSLSHQNGINKACHMIGIPSIALSLLLMLVSPFVTGLFFWAAALFAAGWVLQFAGHLAEGKPPEFFKDWRFLFVGLRWWLAKITGRA